jgi:hypothetical protein
MSRNDLQPLPAGYLVHWVLPKEFVMDQPPDLAARSNPTQQWVVVASQAVMSGKQLIVS